MLELFWQRKEITIQGIHGMQFLQKSHRIATHLLAE